MQKNSDVKAVGYVLRRTDYGETDRILNIITPLGKVAVMARGVRKVKSKLAGGIEPFMRSEFNFHFGRKELGVLTGAKMQQFYRKIIEDLAKMELAAKILKQVDVAAERINAGETDEYFGLVDQSLAAINAGEKLDVVEAWFLINLKKVVGEEINLYRDSDGEKLSADERYVWDGYEKVFRADARGEFGANEIKFLRLMASNELNLIRRIKIESGMMEPIRKMIGEIN